MRVLVDTNILIDWISHRNDHYQNAKEIVQLCAEHRIEGCIAAHSITNMFYILRKNVGFKERNEIFKTLSEIFSIIPIDDLKLSLAVKNEKFIDFEDCLQMECAFSYEADYIITRNIEDFSNSRVKAILPQEYLDNYLN